MARKFKIAIPRDSFCEVIMDEVFRDKYEDFSLKYGHDDPVDGYNSIYFGEDAPEAEIIEYMKKFGDFDRDVASKLMAAENEARAARAGFDAK